MSGRMLSIRLTQEEWERIEQWMHILRERTKGHYVITQRTVLLEALDALDAMNELEHPPDHEKK